MYIFESPYHYVQTISSEPLNLFVNQLGIVVHHSPEGKLGMSDVSLLSGISGLSFWDLLSCFYCLVLLLFLFCHFSANGPFSCLLFSSENLKYFSLRVRLFCMALVEQLGDDSW